MSATRRILRYDILGTLGEGGFARVYRALDLHTGREVALKLLLPGALRADRVESLLREARMVSALSHVNIVSVYECGIFDGAPYFAMELLEGCTVEDRLSTQAVPVAVAIRWAEEVLAGLAAAHAAGVVHGDIHPGNLFLTQSGGVKILDFGSGVARRTDQSPAASSGKPVVFGRAGYIAPELYLGKEPSARSDIYAVGITLYRALSGRMPFDEATTEAIGQRVVRQRAPALAEVAPHVVPWIADAVDRALARDPDARFSDSGAFAAALMSEPTRAAVPTRALAVMGEGERAAISGSATPLFGQKSMQTAPSPTLAPPLAPSANVIAHVPRASRWRHGLFAALGVGVAAGVAYGSLWRTTLRTGRFRDTQSCSGFERLRFEDARIEVPGGSGVVTSGWCELELINSVVVADVGVVADGESVVVRGGRIEGRRGLLLNDGILAVDGTVFDVESGIEATAGTATLSRADVVAKDFGLRVIQGASVVLTDSDVRGKVGIRVGANSTLEMQRSKVSGTDFGVYLKNGSLHASDCTVAGETGIGGQGKVLFEGGRLEGNTYAFSISGPDLVEFRGGVDLVGGAQVGKEVESVDGSVE